MFQVPSSYKVAIFGLLISLAACNKAPIKSANEKPVVESTVPKTFASPADAGAALLAAAQAGDRSGWLEIFGPEGGEVLFTGDQAQDTARMRAFAEAYTKMNRWGKIKAGGQILYIGSDNYAFPIPLDRKSSGRWYFDTASGKDEVLARRIGRHELTAMAACEAVAKAERQYFSHSHDGKVKQYAQKFASDPDKQNGLYWAVTEGQPLSPLGQLGEFGKVVAANTGDHPPLFNGYYYRILARPGDLVDGKMTGGFEILAYPADYRNSGIMTFVVGKDGVVHQKDLGEMTGDIASAMTEFNPADGWTPAIPHTGTASRIQQ